jgi:hypothetical protein
MRIPLSPHDTVPTALLRFVLELAALFAIGAAFGVIQFLVALLALFFAFALFRRLALFFAFALFRR